jgi:SHS2 domain-containing protein
MPAHGLHEIAAMGSRVFEHHTGEVQLRIDAADHAELFAEAARALAELTGTPSAEAPGEWQRVELIARDREALLVAWLSELIALTEMERLHYLDVVVESVTEQHLAALVRGVPFREMRTAVKAASMQDLRIGAGPGRVSATLILEV